MPLPPIIVTERYLAVQRKKVKPRVGIIDDQLKVTKQYTWRDGRKLFLTSMAHMCKLQSKEGVNHKTIEKWKVSVDWTQK
jgi:hypothetical protein